MAARRAVVLLAGMLLPGCGASRESDAIEPPPELVPVQLTDADGWALADRTLDPFAAHAAGRVRCTTADYRAEATWLELTTASCNYATFAHPLRRQAPAGSRVRGEIAWATLAAIDPAVATLAFATDAEVLWSREVPIPGDASVVSVEFEIAPAAAADVPLYFHVRNHGYNSWQLSPLTLDARSRPP